MSINVSNNKPALSWFKRHRAISAVMAVLAFLVFLIVVISFLPFKVEDTSVSNPAKSYEEAAARIEALIAADEASDLIDPLCLQISP